MVQQPINNKNQKVPSKLLNLDEITVRSHYLTAAAITIVKLIVYAIIIYLSFKIINGFLGYDLILQTYEILKESVQNIMEVEAMLAHEIGIEFLEDNVTEVVITLILLAFVHKGHVLNKYWKFTHNDFTYSKGFLSFKKTTLPLDHILRIYAVPKADYKNLGDMYIEITTEEKKLKLPFVYHVNYKVNKISEMVEKYKEGVIEEDIKKDFVKTP